MFVSVLVFRPTGFDVRWLVQGFEEETGGQWPVQVTSSRKAVLEALSNRSCNHLVLVPEDASDGAASLELITAVRAASPESPVVVVASRGNVEIASQAIAAGATDLLVLGDNLSQRIRTLLGKLGGLFEMLDRNRALDEDNAALRDTLRAKLQIVGKSPQALAMMEQIRRVACVPRPVLIVGERGTGKELVARAIHLAGGAANRPMVTVNCAAFNDALLESELFGHEKGAFTGAETARRGKFEQADGGTLFLDEIGNMSVSFQEKILRVVEYGTFTRVGGSQELKTAARIIAATNKNLREQIAGGFFLADLYDRLTFETIQVPPLRARQGDVPVLAQYFLDQFACEIPAFAGKRLARSAIDVLQQYSFPGNVRELKNIIERAAYRDVGNEITPEDLGLAPQGAPATASGSFHERIEALARQLVGEAIRQADGNQAQAARNLGLPYHQFRYYLRKHEANLEACPHCGKPSREASADDPPVHPRTKRARRAGP